MGDNAATFQRQQLLDLLLRKKGIEARQVNAIVPRQKSDANLLSYGQERLWVLDQLEPDSSLYNIPLAIHLIGSLDESALGRSLEEIVRRHQVLRSSVTGMEDPPVQVIAPLATLNLAVVDLRWLGEGEKKSEVQRLADEEARRSFDLTRAPLIRAGLLRLSGEEHILLLTMHHIASDGWSVGILFQELSVLYDAFSSGRPSPLPDLPIQYADYAAWQRQWLQGEVLDSQLRYWKQQLAGAPAVLELPTDRSRPAVQSYRGASQELTISSALTKGLKALSRNEGVTLFATLLAAFQVLMHRYTRSEDIIIGSPIANRNRSEIEGLIGFFVNNLVLRGDLSGDPSFRELVKRVWKTALEAYAYQDLPFEKLVEELQPERSLSHSPLYQVMFILQNAPMELPKLGRVTATRRIMKREKSKFDLTLDLNEEGGSLLGCVEYNTDLFDEGTIRRMIGHYGRLLEGILEYSHRRISQLPLLLEAERHQILAEWNDTDRDYPKDKCVHELFEEQVEKTPDAVAVVFGDEELTYGELNRRANQLAHYLRKLGVGPEVLAGICVERSVEMVVGLLGILKAGGAYVPLDPGYPRERLAYVIEDAQIKIVLTQQDLVAGLGSDARVVCLDADGSIINEESEHNPQGAAGGESRAYVIYTSGSTGRPKGVEISHRAVVNFLSSMREQPGIAEKDILLAVTTISFDIAGLELYLPLMIGARVVIARREITTDGARLSHYIDEVEATVMQATPATWQMLLSAGWQGRKQLRILCGGEALSGELAGQLLERAESVWNLYGPTETTIWSTLCKVEIGERSVSIGRPLANTEIYILDHHMQAVPIGIPGELHIGGAGLARGYLNRPELTAEKFVANPFREDPHARLYKTGDLARYREDGNIEYLGRLDHQVKIRGFRIELGEIESVLAEHPDVGQAAVYLWTVKPNDIRIVACCVPAKAGVVAPIRLRKHLIARLPEYMIPHYFVSISEVPLMPNGKVDRQRLPRPVAAESQLGREEAPATPSEAKIAEIWTMLIHPARSINRLDRFFELGGHSLLALQALRKMEDTFSTKLEPRILFQETLAEIAMRCRPELMAGAVGQDGSDRTVAVAPI